MNVGGLVIIIALLVCTQAGWAAEWSGYVSAEPRYFFEAPGFDEQPSRGMSASAALAPEYRIRWNDGDDLLTLAAFVRVDADDDERTHADVREAFWQHVDERWAWKVGIGRVFWGVTESRHLVDIVNQTDLVEDFDEEDKLGQPMIHAERWTPVGTFGLFLLPGFRERTFPEASARLSGGAVVADDATFESGAGQHRLDVAGRWFHALGRWDIGVSAFHGTGREPRLVPAPRAGNAVEFVPHYDEITQLGLDLQYTRGSWLWKLESTLRDGQGRDFSAAVAGFEYTAFGIAGSDADLGLLAEYLYDDRGPGAPRTIYDDDWFGGLRLSLNDVAGTTLLAGAIVDKGSMIAIVEAQRRLRSHWKIEAEVRWFSDVDPGESLLFAVHRDSYLTLRLARYF